MGRGQKTNAEQVVLKLRQIEVQTAQNKILASACNEAEISERSYDRWRKEYGGQPVLPDADGCSVYQQPRRDQGVG